MRLLDLTAKPLQSSREKIKLEMGRFDVKLRPRLPVTVSPIVTRRRAIQPTIPRITPTEAEKKDGFNQMVLARQYNN